MSRANGWSCRQAVDADVACVAKIHLAAFDGFFLSQLGYRFLCVMYRTFLRSPSTLFIVLETKSGELAGFAVGSFREKNDRWLAIRSLPHFLLAVIPAVLRNPAPVVQRLWARFFDDSESLQLPIGAAVLRSIGVLPSARGTGMADSILQAFETLARSTGAEHLFLTTDEMKNERTQRFYVRAGYELVARFQQDRKRGMWLMSKDLKGPIHE